VFDEVHRHLPCLEFSEGRIRAHAGRKAAAVPREITNESRVLSETGFPQLPRRVITPRETPGLRAGARVRGAGRVPKSPSPPVPPPPGD
jgi:hypothetical protein